MKPILTFFILMITCSTNTFAQGISSAKNLKVADEIVVFHTIAGDLELSFFPNLAPEHVAQIIKLTKAGVYNGTHFYRIHENFVAQISSAEDRTTPLTTEQSAIIHKLNAEFSDMPHRAGVLSMAHMDNDINSAETSFSILLGNAPHLDGKYTIFGYLSAGYDVIQEFLKVPQKDEHRPDIRLTIISAEVVTKKEGERRTQTGSAIPLVIPPSIETQSNNANLAMIGLLSMLVLNTISILCYGFSKSTRYPVSLVLLSNTIGYFIFIILATPIGHQQSLLALGLFVGLVSLFKLLGRFDKPDAG